MLSLYGLGRGSGLGLGRIPVSLSCYAQSQGGGCHGTLDDLDDLDRTVKRVGRDDAGGGRDVPRLWPGLSGESATAGAAVSGVLAAGASPLVLLA